MGIVDKAKEALGDRSDKAKEAVDKGGDMIDQKTGGKAAGQVDSAQDKAKEVIDEKMPDK
ncbi:MAG TPA: antitoxin [Candidatus Limnocylindrales bacterium]|nr:antitoxin [Candidatus Limnocylindrales bacterium]